MKFAKAVYCAGVDSWYVRLGPLHGIDQMFLQSSEQQAKFAAKLIDKTLNRELKKRHEALKGGKA